MNTLRGRTPQASARTASMIALTVLIVIYGLIGSLGNLPVLKYMLDQRSLPTIFGGIRALSGPFEALGIDAMFVAGLLFAVVSGFNLLAAYWVWSLRMDGVMLELILLGLSIPFWYGFAIPYGPILGLLILLLLVVTRKSFT